jgi:hypothetical protein
VPVNRKWTDRGGKPLVYVGVKSIERISSGRLVMPDAAFRAAGSESSREAFSSPVSIDSMPSGLVSFR